MGQRGSDDNFYEFQKLTLALTTACNLTCRMCRVIRGPQGTLSREQALQVAEFAGRRGFKEIEVTGGEPTLVRYLWDVIDRLCDTGAEVRLVTNGLLLTKEDARRLACHPNLWVQVSIDGIGEVHDSIRGCRGVFGRTERALRALADGGCRVAINTVVQRSNFRHMIELYERYKNMPLRFHAFILVEFHEIVGDDEQIRPEDLDEFVKVMSEIMRRGKRDGNDVILSNDLLQAYRRRVQYPLFIMHPGKGCTVVRRGLFVTPDSYVAPCVHRLWESDRIQRRLHQRSIDEIVDSPEARDDIIHVAGPEGCPGCNTMCYNWDEDFRRKVLHPSGLLRMRRAVFCGKQYVKAHYPRVYAVGRSVKRCLRL